MINSTIKHRLNYLSLKASTSRSHMHQPSVSESEASTHSHTRTTQPNPESQTQKKLSFPYVKGLSEKLSGILKPFNVKISPRNINDLPHFYKIAKDPTPKLDTSHIYNIPCIYCTANYIGTIQRPLKTRIQEHKKDAYNPPEKWTALTRHTWYQDYRFNFDEVKNPQLKKKIAGFIVYYVPRRIMRVITRRATMPAGDRSQGVAETKPRRSRHSEKNI